MTNLFSPSCRICQNTQNNKIYTIKEMMFGSRETFDYFQCGSCGCLQIVTIPDDLARHYPKHYFSFKRLNRTSQNIIRHFFDQRRVNYTLGTFSFIGKIAGYFSKPLNYLTWIKASKLTTDANILDVGCGKGQLLLRMKLGGFKHCTGIDPFLQETIHYHNDIIIHKTTLADFVDTRPNKFDLIMFHHSLEHMENPLQILQYAKALLSAQGTILVRVPVADSYAWEYYGVNWPHIDAPRHLYLLTQASLTKLAAQAQLSVTKVEYDSTAYQLIGSELYQRDIPMIAHKNRKKYFNAKQLQAFETQTQHLNASGKGDQAVFYLSHSSL